MAYNNSERPASRRPARRRRKVCVFCKGLNIFQTYPLGK